MAIRVLTPDDIRCLEPPEWLIDELFPEGGLFVLFGRSGGGKTFLALDWALCIASGLAWRGRRCEAGGVWYLAGEGVYDLRERIASWQEYTPLADIRRFRAIEGDINIADEGCLSEIAAAIEGEEEAPVLLIVDTLARCTPGSDENSASSVGQVIAKCDQLRKRLGCAIMLVHHTGKDGETERGSSSLRCAADTMVKLTGASDCMVLYCEKQRSWGPFPPMRFRLEMVGGSCVLEEAGEGRCEPGVGDTFLAEIAPRLLAEGSLCEEGLKTEFIGRTGLSAKTYYRRRKDWEKAGLVQYASLRLAPTEKLQEFYPKGMTNGKHEDQNPSDPLPFLDNGGTH